MFTTITDNPYTGDAIPIEAVPFKNLVNKQEREEDNGEPHAIVARGKLTALLKWRDLVVGITPYAGCLSREERSTCSYQMR